MVYGIIQYFKNFPEGTEPFDYLFSSEMGFIRFVFHFGMSMCAIAYLLYILINYCY